LDVDRSKRLKAEKASGAEDTPALEKAPTGIEGLDEVTLGGLPKGRPTLLCGSAGCGKTLIAMTFLVNGAAKYGDPGVFMSFEERSGDLAANVASLGYDLDALIADKQLVIDHVRVEPSEIEVSGEFDFEPLFVRLGYAVDQVGAKRVVLDTIEALFSGFKDQAVLRAEVRRLFGWLKDRGVTAVITGERGEGQLTRHRGIRIRLRDPAGQPRPQRGQHPSPSGRQVSRLVARGQRIPLPDRHPRRQRHADHLRRPAAQCLLRHRAKRHYRP
jgi:KaiC/GvpD/RAD55 family RecA-like ATPase